MLRPEKTPGTEIDISHVARPSQPLGVLTFPLSQYPLSAEPRGGLGQRIGFFLLALYTSGEGVHWVDGEGYEVKPGSLIFVRPRQVHRVATANGISGECIALHPDFVPPQDDVGRHWISAVPTRQSLCPARQQDFLCLTRAVLRYSWNAGAYEDRRRAAQQRIMSLLLELSLPPGIREATTRESVPEKLRAGWVLRGFEALIKKHLSDRLSIQEYARKIGCAERTLTRVTLVVHGCTAKQYLDERTATEFKRLLLQTTMTVTDISYRLGFGDGSHGVRFFHRMESCTPEEYRRRNRQHRVVDVQ